MATRRCNHCGNAYSRPPTLMGKFCSKRCGYDARRVPIPAGYRMIYAPKHPLAFKAPYVPEHRMKLFDAIGVGTHPCHWCGVTLRWHPGGKTSYGTLTVDHLDGNHKNNALNNLVPSCQGCNGNRWHWVGDDELYIETRTRRLRAARLNCPTCGGEFLVPLGLLKEKGVVRYCSPRCHYDRNKANP